MVVMVMVMAMVMAMVMVMLNHRVSSQHLILSDSFMPQLNLPQLTRNQILFVNSFTSKLFRAMKKCDK
jgi:hypothetical protein